jgi:hypothetical protein
VAGLEGEMELRRSQAREFEAELEKAKAEQIQAEKALAEESRYLEDAGRKRQALQEKKEVCSKRLRDLGAAPAGLERQVITLTQPTHYLACFSGFRPFDRLTKTITIVSSSGIRITLSLLWCDPLKKSQRS